MAFPQLIAKRFPTFSQLQLEATAIVPSFVREQTDEMLNNAHETSQGYVGSSPSLQTVIVAHQGTDPQKL
jgi:hypothetical protein